MGTRSPGREGDEAPAAEWSGMALERLAPLVRRRSNISEVDTAAALFSVASEFGLGRAPWERSHFMRGSLLWSMAELDRLRSR